MNVLSSIYTHEPECFPIVRPLLFALFGVGNTSRYSQLGDLLNLLALSLTVELARCTEYHLHFYVDWH